MNYFDVVARGRARKLFCCVVTLFSPDGALFRMLSKSYKWKFVWRNSFILIFLYSLCFFLKANKTKQIDIFHPIKTIPLKCP